MDTKGGKWWWCGGGGLMNWEIGIDVYVLICIKWITNMNLLFKKTNKIKFKKKKKIYKNISIGHTIKISLNVLNGYVLTPQ